MRDQRKRRKMNTSGDKKKKKKGKEKKTFRRMTVWRERNRGNDRKRVK